MVVCLLAACFLFLPSAFPVALQNPSFEISGGGGGPADWWSNNGIAGAEGWGGHSGSNLMALYSSEGGNGDFYQDYGSGQEEYRYTFAIYACKDAALSADWVELRLLWLDSGSSVIGGVTNSILSGLTTDWLQFSVEGISAAGTEGVRIEVGGQNLNTLAAKFDDASLDEEAVIPEPATVACALLGALVFSVRRSLRKSA